MSANSIALYLSAHGNERFERQAVGAAWPTAPAAKTPDWSSCQGPPHHPQWHPLDLAGSPWRALPERYGSWKTVSSRFYRWQRAGVWQRILAALQRRADRDGRLDSSLHFVDSTVVRAHQHAAGAKGGIQQTRHWGAAGVAIARRSISGVIGVASPWSSS